MKAYSLDLREKIVEAHLHHEGSIRHLAKRFKVSVRFVWGLIHRFRSTRALVLRNLMAGVIRHALMPRSMRPSRR